MHIVIAGAIGGGKDTLAKAIKGALPPYHKMSVAPISNQIEYLLDVMMTGGEGVPYIQKDLAAEGIHIPSNELGPLHELKEIVIADAAADSDDYLNSYAIGHRKYFIEMATRLRAITGDPAIFCRMIYYDFMWLPNKRPQPRNLADIRRYRKGVIVSGVRHPQEIEYFKNHGGAYSINIATPAQLRTLHVQYREKFADDDIDYQSLPSENLLADYPFDQVVVNDEDTDLAEVAKDIVDRVIMPCYTVADALQILSAP